MLATLLADSGRFEEAREGYERAIAAAPALAGCYYDLSRCRRLVAADRPLMSRMQTTLQSPSLTADARLKVHLALGKAFDDLGDPETAMRHFDDAEAARRSLMHFDAHAFEQRVDRLIAHFTPDRVARTPEGAPQDGRTGGETAVLILGLPRSGTTLVEHILSSHPLVHPAGELSFWTRRGAEWEASGLEHAQNPHAQPAAFTTLSADYRKLLQRLAPHAARVTDKMPLNVLWAGLIHMALPQATMIYCQRPAVDTAWSIHRTYFNPQLAFPTGGLDLVRAIRAVERLAAHWRSVLPPDRFVEIGYGQLVADPDRTIRRLIAGCHLPWDPA